MRRNPRNVLFVFLCVAVVASSCGGVFGTSPAAATSPGEGSDMSPRRIGAIAQAPGLGSDGGLVMRLSEGSAAGTLPTPPPTGAAAALDPSSLQAVLNRLPALQGAPADQQEFVRPASSLPAPRPGKTVTETFPPPAPAAAQQPPAPTALEVLRHAPDGAVPLAPYLSVTFNQPMVALTGLEDLAAAAVPVQLEPRVPGKWRWVGAQTLLFEPAGPAATGESAGAITPDRFPMATSYTVTVPAGTVSANGGRLAQAVRWTFNTPPPQMQSGYPSGGPQPLKPVFFAAFDQRINPEAVLKAIQVRAGSQTYTLRLATADEVKADEAVARLAAAAPAGRWLAFRAADPFPPDVNVTVRLGPGLPSAEGPRVSDKEQSFTFRTYGPLKVADSQCGYNNNCPPLMPWIVRFTNPLDTSVFDEASVKVEPVVPGVKIDAMADNLVIQGATKGRTTYKVTLRSDIKDIFGQTLGSDQVLRFQVGSSDPILAGPGRNVVVIDPSSTRPSFSVYSINVPRLKVQVQAVTPDDWSTYLRYLQDQYRQDVRPPLPGKQVLNQTIQVSAQPDEMAETAIDLSPTLPGGLGQLVVVVQPDGVATTNRGQLNPVTAWVQATHIGLDAAVDNERILVWANSLADGAPLAGVDLILAPSPSSALPRTGPDGTVSIPLPSAAGANLLIARLGQDLAILPQNEYYWGGDGEGWRAQPAQDEFRWYVFDDRGMYRPGEDVHVKGWLRRVGNGKGGDIGPLAGAAGQVGYVLMDPRGNRLLNGTAKLSALGGFDFVLTLPKETNLGAVTLQLTAEAPGGLAGREFGHTFQVQEFRRPEFEVSAKAEDGPYLVGGHAIATVQANYYAGGGLPNAEVTWNVRSSPGSFTPPNWSDYTFGIWQPWWGPMIEKPVNPAFYGGGGPAQTFTGRTDASGAHSLRIDFDSVTPPQPTNVSAEATVMDVNRQAWTASTQLLVHPASLYVGLRTDRIFVEQGQPLRVDAIVPDLDGAAVPNIAIEMKAARLDWRYKNGSWAEVEAAVQPCTVTSGKDPVRCTFETGEGGTYRITATVKDSQGRTNLTQLTRWVSGGRRPPARDVEQEQVTLIPDRKEYRPGDTAEILLQAPFYPAEGVLTLRRSGLVSSERFTLSGPTTTLKVPVVEGYIPNVGVQVDLVGAAPRLTDAGEVDNQLPKRPAYATGSLNLPVPPLARTLSVTAVPRDAALAPGGSTSVELVVKDAAGQPVKDAEVAVVVVDEAVLSLTNYQLQDPLAAFYGQRPPGAGDWHSRGEIVLVNPASLAGGRGGGPAATQTVAEKGVRNLAMPAAAPAAAAPTEAPGAAGAAADMSQANAGPPIALRTDFNALALFAPAVTTDAQGRARVDIKLPDNLTRYRVMVAAVAGGKQFGMGESAITARLPLMVRPSAPRFLNFGDRFELPVVLQNQTTRPMTVSVAARAANAVFVRSTGEQATSSGYTVQVPANDRIEVRFPATTVRPGTARFQFGAVAAGTAQSVAVTATLPADAAEVALPVYTPATTEAFATYGVVDSGAIAQPVIAPSNVYTQFGGLEVTTSSTALQALTDAVLYLTAYRFECSEQLASRVLAVAALRDVLTAFQAEGLPSPDDMQAAVTRDINRLRALQNPDGGWPVWVRGDESWPFYTIHVAHALQRAKDKGFDVPTDALDRARPYLQNIEQHIPSWYGAQARRSLVAYALYVRKLMGDTDTAKARQLANEGLRNVTKAGADISPEALGWLLYVMTGDSGSQREVDAIRQYLANHTVETAGAANFVTSYGDDAYLLLGSDRRADAVILEALIADQPKSDLIPKIVNGLLAHRVQGRWGNTQENTFVLLALDRYFNTYEAQTPDFVARLWLGDQYAGDHAFKGRTTERAQINVPMAYLAQAGSAAQGLVLSKEGQGRLYYRLGLRYAPKSLDLKPLDAGFTVERAYEAVDDPADVRRDADGAWHVKAGARVRVRVTMVAPSRRYHVALVDPLPAGFEALNPALAVTGSMPSDQGPQAAPAVAAMARPVWSWWRWWTWYDHQNLRDDRAEAFTSLLWEGVYTYTYVARATTPGTFVVPPAKAEEMYSPETFGRSGTGRVVIE